MHVDDPASATEPKTSAPARETAKTVAVVAGTVLVAMVAFVGAVVVYIYSPFVVAAAIATSPVWGTWIIVAKHRERVKQQFIFNAGLEAGDVVLANGESASAVLQFADGGGDVDADHLRTAFVALHVSDEVERDWTAEIPLTVPK